MPSAKSIAEDVLHKALEFSARKISAPILEEAIARLKAGDTQAHSYFQYALAEEVGDALGALDEHVEAVYLFDYEATPEDVAFSETHSPPLVHVLILTQRKTEALQALVSMLDRALAQGYAGRMHLERLQHLLDVQIIDAGDVEQNVGYGALLRSIHHRPLRVWKRA
jgi:hypothetical protein